MLSIRWSVKGVFYWELLPKKSRIQLNKLAAEMKFKDFLRGKLEYTCKLVTFWYLTPHISSNIVPSLLNITFSYRW